MRFLNWSILAAAFVAATTLALADEKKGNATNKADAQNDLERLQGTWTLVSRERNGRKTSEEDVKHWQLTIKGDQWTVKFPGGVDKATIKIDPTKDPKTIDLNVEYRNANVLERGIYALIDTPDGETLKLCRVDQRGHPRPKDFKTTDNSTILFVWKRASK
jgi:uncharacterized protein (TIGR03067 family)